MVSLSERVCAGSATPRRIYQILPAIRRLGKGKG